MKFNNIKIHFYKKKKKMQTIDNIYIYIYVYKRFDKLVHFLTTE